MSKFGIDVSTHNGSLDWAALKKAGVDFAIIRGGYGRYAVDSQFRSNMTGAALQGIPVGVYWFSYALDEAGARAEAQKCLETIREFPVVLPVFFDFEYDTIRYAKEQGVTLDRTAFNDHAAAFCGEIQAAGYTPGVYYNLDYYRSMVDRDQLGGYVQWFAQYAASPSIDRYDLWQYTSSGTLTGLSGRFDFNILENEALLAGPKRLLTGWQKRDGKWYFYDQEGTMAAEQWIFDRGNSYYLGADGAMVTDRSLKLGPDGKLVPAGAHYGTLGQVPEAYRPTLDKLIQAGILKGRSGSGDSLVLDLSEDAVRLLVLLDRSGQFD